MKVGKLWLIITPLLIWAIYTYPLVFDFSGSIYSDYLGDSAGLIARLNEGLAGAALGELLAPCSLVFRLLSLFVPATAVYNLAVLLSFVGTFFFGFLFLRSLDFEPAICYFFAFVLTLAPIRLWYSFEWPNHAQWGFILLYLIFLVRFLKLYALSEEPLGFAKQSLRVSVLSGFFFALTLSENYYHGFMLFFLTLFALGFTVVYGRRGNSDSFPCRLFPLVIFALSALIFSLPALYRFQFWVPPDAAQGVSTIAVSASRGPEDRFTFSARPWHYFIPDINHPLFGDAALKIHKWLWSRPPYYLTERFFPKEHTLYLGFTLLLLSGYALFRVLFKKRGSVKERFHILLFTFLAAAMMIFSFPPYVGIGGFKLFFPSHFLYRIFPQVRAYARFGTLVFVCNAVVASFGLKMLLEKVRFRLPFERSREPFSTPPPLPEKGRGRSKNKGYVTPAMTIILTPVFSAVFLEFLNFPPFHNISTRPPAAYLWLAEQEGDFSYLEYPTRIYYTDRLYQHTHGKRILNPYHRTPPEVKELVREIDSPEFVSRFAAWGGRYIFFHRPEEKSEKQRAAESWGFPVWGTHAKLPEPEEEKSEAYFQDDPRFKKVYDSADIIVFEVGGR